MLVHSCVPASDGDEPVGPMILVDLVPRMVEAVALILKTLELPRLRDCGLNDPPGAEHTDVLEIFALVEVDQVTVVLLVRHANGQLEMRDMPDDMDFHPGLIRWALFQRHSDASNSRQVGHAWA